MYIRQLIIRERLEDLQLGVESYQNHLNLTKPQLMIGELHGVSQLTILQQPKFGVTYLNSKHQLRFMRFDKIHKFCDITLQKVRDGLLERLTDDLKKVDEKIPTRWNSSTRRMVKNFIHAIEERLNRREQIRRLESYIGARPSFSILTFQRPNAKFTDFNALVPPQT